MAIKRLTDEEVGAIRFQSQNLLSSLCCPEGTAQCPRCQTIRGAFFLALEVQDRRSAGKGVQISTVIDHRLDDTALRAKPLVPQKQPEPLEDATQEMATVLPQD
ncbi:MAG TPA: hypothetical protein VGK67_18620 [Myxococcales bacterium]|jgi:hypothetical protein